MKKIIFFVLTVIMIFPACQEDLLEKYPKTTLNSEIFWKNETDVLAGVNALYAKLPGMGWMNYDLWSDIALFAWVRNQKIEGNTEAADMPIGGYQNALPMWKNSYKAITAVNFFLEKVVEVQDINENLLLRVQSEARFIRAFYYMQLVMNFGDVPLITETISQEEGFLVTRDPIDQIWDYIETELSEIHTSLPVQYSGADVGRITAGAVHTLKAKCMLYAGRYQKAYDAAKQVIDMGVYSLYPDYSSLFGYAAQNNSEVILDFQYLQDLKSNSHFSANAPNGMSITNVCEYNVTSEMVNAFQMQTTGLDIDDPDSGWDPMNPYANRDPRLKGTIFIPYFSDDTEAFILWNTGEKLMPQPGSGTVDEVKVTHLRNKTGYFISKYINEEDLEDPGNCGTNFIILRYADVLLIASEALIELNTNLSEAQGYIEQVRLRAEMPTLNESISSQGDLRQAVRHERLVELGTEGWRYFDINRWRIAEDVVQGAITGMSYLDADGNIQTIEAGVIRDFDPNKDYLLPIPLSEITMNPNLTQNSGY